MNRNSKRNSKRMSPIIIFINTRDTTHLGHLRHYNSEASQPNSSILQQAQKGPPAHSVAQRPRARPEHGNHKIKRTKHAQTLLPSLHSKINPQTTTMSSPASRPTQILSHLTIPLQTKIPPTTSTSCLNMPPHPPSADGLLGCQRRYHTCYPKEERNYDANECSMESELQDV